MNLSKVKIISILMFCIALLLVISTAYYLVIDYKYPTDARWIEENLNDNRISGTFKVEDAIKDGISEKEIAQHLAQDFSDRRERFKKILFITFPSVVVVMVLVAVGLAMLCDESTTTMATETLQQESVSSLDKKQSPKINGPIEINKTIPNETSLRIKGFSWKSLSAAIIIAAFFTSFMAAAVGIDSPKNIIATAMWIYLSIEAWQYWQWKAILPYPLFIFASAISGLILLSSNIEQSTWTYIIVNVTLNIGGLVMFYILLRKSQKEQMEI